MNSKTVGETKYVLNVSINSNVGASSSASAKAQLQFSFEYMSAFLAHNF